MWYLWFDWHPLDEVTEWSRHCGDLDVERVRLPRCQRPLVWVRRQPLPELRRPQMNTMPRSYSCESRTHRFAILPCTPIHRLSVWFPSDCSFLKPKPPFSEKLHGDLFRF